VALLLQLTDAHDGLHVFSFHIVCLLFDDYFFTIIYIDATLRRLGVEALTRDGIPSLTPGPSGEGESKAPRFSGENLGG
jgi:hypothetical protein